MPNWTSNRFTAKNVTADQWRCLAASFNNGFLQTFNPVPDSLSEESAHDFRCQHWNTKWEVDAADVVGDQPNTDFEGTFATAWAPPSEECMELISEQFPNSLHILKYLGEGNQFFGVTVALNGMSLNWDADASEFEVYDEDDYDDEVTMDKLYKVQDEVAAEMIQQMTAPEFDLCDPAKNLRKKQDRDSKILAAKKAMEKMLASI